MEFSIFHDADMGLWVNALGYLGLAAVIFAETGLFFCFFFPGDSLLFSAGLFAARGIYNIYLLVPLLIVSAIIGYTLGYIIGVYLGKWLSSRPDTWYFKKRYLEQAHLFYDKHGKKALLFGRLIPVVRSFAPLVAGMIRMPFWTYTFFNVLGAILWAGAITMLGYFLGGVLPDASEYIIFIVVLIIILSASPAIIQWCKKRM